MAGGLAPGGVLTLFYGTYYQATFLPGRARLERLTKAASELRWGLAGDGPRVAGLSRVRRVQSRGRPG
jgi:hypothetical protein